MKKDRKLDVVALLVRLTLYWFYSTFESVCVFKICCSTMWTKYIRGHTNGVLHAAFSFKLTTSKAETFISCFMINVRDSNVGVSLLPIKNLNSGRSGP